jgi:hypothetical protein
MSTLTDALKTDQIRKVDRIRGHRFAPPEATAKKIPLYGTQDNVPFNEQIVHVHYFMGACDWYITEYEPSSGIAYGYADLGFGYGEWGSIYLPELAEYQQTYLVVERELDWKPTPVTDIDKISG